MKSSFSHLCGAVLLVSVSFSRIVSADMGLEGKRVGDWVVHPNMKNGAFVFCSADLIRQGSELFVILNEEAALSLFFRRRTLGLS